MYNRQQKYLDLVLKNNKVPHAFLFYGPNQSAIKTIAQNFIYKINTGAANWGGFFNESHPDILLVKKLEDKREIGIAQIRGLKSFLSQSPFSLTTKAALIEGAENLTEESWNAMLKSLEEPAPNNIIFIISSGLSYLPKTIISRAVAISFNQAVDKPAPTENDIIKQLKRVTGLSVSDRFDLAEKIAKLGNIPEVLDEWLLFLRFHVFSPEVANKNKIALDINSILKTKKIIISTNANPRLMLERLMLEIA